MSARAIIGAGGLPILVRAERVPLSLTRASIERLAELAAQHLEQIEELIAEAPTEGVDARLASATAALHAERIGLIDALAELRGQR